MLGGSGTGTVGTLVKLEGFDLCSDADKLSNETHRSPLAAVVGVDVDGKDDGGSLLSVLVLLVSSTNDDGTLTLPLPPGDIFSNKFDGMSRILCVNMCCFMLPCNKCSSKILKYVRIKFT